MDAELQLGHSEPPFTLEALPDNEFDVVLRQLYQAVWECDTDYHGRLAIEGRGIASAISALAASTRCLRDIVWRVRSQACYELRGRALCGRSIAEHLNIHQSCTSVCVVATPSDEHFLAELVDFLCHVSSSASLRVKHLTICCSNRHPERASRKWQYQDTANVEGSSDEGPSDAGSVALGPGQLRSKDILHMARAFPGLEALTIVARFHGTSDLCASLAACCPHLHSLEVRVLDLLADPLCSLSALRGLTSLVLEERATSCPDKWDQEVWYEGGGRSRALAGLMPQLAALSALTHLGLSIGYELPAEGLSAILPPLGHTQLCSLELRAEGFFHVNNFPALAAAFPCLEQLSCVTLEDHPEAPGAQNIFGAAGPVGWCMPHLRVISTERDSDHGFGIEGLLRLAAGCPALRRLSGSKILNGILAVALSWERSQQEQGAGQDAAAVALGWLEGIDTLLARGLLGDVQLELEATSAEELDSFCAALEHYQPADRRAVVAARINTLFSDCIEYDAAMIGRLEAIMPQLRMRRV